MTENEFDYVPLSISGNTIPVPEEIKQEPIEEFNIPNIEKEETTEKEKELTEEEKYAKFIEAIKQSHIRYHPKKHFGVEYKKKRRVKNKMQRKSRKKNK